jgi:hypothetical protein
MASDSSKSISKFYCINKSISINIEDSEGVVYVEVSFTGKVDLCSFKFPFKVALFFQ